VLTIETVSDVPDSFLPEEPEGRAFYRAFARAGVAGFDLGCLLARRGADVVSAVPYFVMRFNVGTMLPPGLAKRMLGAVGLRIACVGHPSADIGHIHGNTSPEVLAAINAELARRAPIVCYKGFGPDLPLPGFTRVEGLPVPVLQVPPDFWQRTSARRRRDLKRQLKYAASLRFEERDGLPAHLVDRVLDLYTATHERAETQFERLNRGYFVETAAISKYLLFFDGERLIGFAQTLCGHGRMVHKYVGMDYERNRQYRLYFALFLKAVDICLRDGLAELNAGVTAYDFKRHLGCVPQPTWVYYHHRRPLANWLLARFAFLLAPSASELRGLEPGSAHYA
jgi:hypothetical protein